VVCQIALQVAIQAKQIGCFMPGAKAKDK